MRFPQAEAYQAWKKKGYHQVCREEPKRIKTFTINLKATKYMSYEDLE